MESLYLLVPLSLLIVLVAVCAFFMMSDSGQFDDLVGPALRLLEDDDSTFQDVKKGNEKDVSKTIN